MSRIFVLFRLSAALGNIVYVTSFLATDILSEKYEKKEVKRAVYIGFYTLIVMAGFMNLASYSNRRTRILPRIAGASLLAFWVSQLHDGWAYQFWKKTISLIQIHMVADCRCPHFDLRKEGILPIYCI